ncbi:MAG: right-handed parallel beta-helix repeat-containing protein, partial [Clostridia bacterium]|nr:right-handed parallel beta-helix repeat-containing protein [Clostridia bacterium]
YTQGSAIMIDTSEQDSIYVAEEKAVKIANTIVSGDSKLACGSSVTIKAEVQNQLGIPGNLDQSVKWYVTNQDKTAEEKGFTVVNNGNTVTVTPGETVEDGTYAVVAQSGIYGFVKTQYISVVGKTYTNTGTPIMAENMIPKSDDELQSRPRWIRANLNRNGDRIDYITDEDGWTELGASKSTSVYVTTGSTTQSNPYTGYDGIVIKSGLEFEAGKSYCVSARAKLADKTLHEDVYPTTENANAAFGIAITNETFNSTSYTNEYGSGGMALSSEYKDYKGTIRIKDEYKNEGPHMFVLGYPGGYTEGSAMSIDTSCQDAVYVAPEQAYELRISSENNEKRIEPGSTLKLDAHMLNQLGLEGNLTQDLQWYAMDKSRETFISGITITPSDDKKSAEITVDETVDSGIYDIVVASDANNFINGYEIIVQQADYKIYVDAVKGNDSNAGTKDAPLATLLGARNKVRSIRKNLTNQNIIVEFAEGTYRFTNGVTFDAEDSGSEACVIKYAAAAGARVEFSGAADIDISNAGLVTDASILNRMYPEVRDKVVCVNIADQFPYALSGETRHEIQTGHIYKNRENVELFDGDVRRPLAQWPNGDDNYERYESAASTNSFVYAASDIPARWSSAKDFWVGGYFTWDYRYTRHFVEAVDPSSRTITLEAPQSSAFELGQQTGTQKISQRWQAFNLLEEIDVPGEWYLDRDTMNLYYYKPEGGSDKLEMSALYANMIEISNANYISFEGISFTKSRAKAVVIIDSNNINIIGCTFTNLGSDAIYTTGTKLAETDKNYWQRQSIDASYNCHFDNNIFSNIGGMAVQISGGNVDTLTPSGNTFKNNIVYRCSMYKKDEDTILVLGCGNEVSHNNISRLPFQAVRVMGNDHKITYNEIYNVCQETEDCGVLYAGRNTIARGHEFAYNYIHEGNSVNHIVDRSFNVGIYWDDRQSGEWAHHNIIKGVNTGMFGEGVDNIVEYNTVIDTSTFLKLQPKGVAPNVNDSTQTSFGGYIHDTALYYAKYPNLETAINNPTSNSTKRLTKAIGNYGVNSGTEGLASNSWFISTITKSGNKQVSSCSDFADAAGGDYRLKAGSDTAVSYPNLLNTSNFDINLIGLETEATLGASFSPVAPIGKVAKADTVYFTWEDVLGATSYKLTVAKDSAFSNVVYEGTTPYAWAEAELTDSGEYYWRVTAVNSSLEMGEEWTSETAQFTYGKTVEISDVNYEIDNSYVAVTANVSADYVCEADAYIAFYAEDGTLISAERQTLSLGGNVKNIFAEVDTIPANVVIYLWDGNQKPYLYKTEIEIK